MARDNRPERRVVGGPCQYKTYPGRATILSVQKQEGETRSGGPADGYEVKFSFIPHEHIEEDWVQVEGSEHLLLLTHSRLPGLGFLRQYGIEPGRSLECHMKVMVRGTCTPILFDFPGIDLSDDCENK